MGDYSNIIYFLIWDVVVLKKKILNHLSPPFIAGETFLSTVKCTV